MSKGWLVALVSLAVIGIALVSIGCGLISYFNKRVSHTVDESVVLKNGTEGYKAWLHPPAPIYLEFYFFHVLNPNDIVNGSKPHVEQRGPYVYRETREKRYVSFSENSTELQYREGKWYVFDAVRSNGTEDDNITTVDIALMTIANRVRYLPSRIQRFIKAVLRGLDGTLYMEKSVKQLLWGYKPDILERLRDLLPSVLKPLVPNITAGFYVDKTANGTDSGPLEISTGVSNVRELGKVLKWNNNSTLPFWTTDKCNMINGTDGAVFHPGLDKSSRLPIFVVDMCRSLYITYQKTSYVSSSNIPVYQYGVPSELLANTTVNPDNEGFCTPKNNCMKAGVLNVTSCKGNVPIMISMPHFIDADGEYRNAIDGLKPSSDELRTIIEAEPMTGFVMNAAKKIQINYYVEANLTSFEPTQHIRQNFVFPMFWINEHATISDEDASRFKHEVLQQVMMANALVYAMIGIGALFILIVIVLSVVVCVRARHNQEDTARVSSGEDDEPLLTDA